MTGTRFGIGMDDRGLLQAGDGGQRPHLDGRRRGGNAGHPPSRLCRRDQRPLVQRPLFRHATCRAVRRSGRVVRRQTSRIRRSFRETFWIPEKGCLGRRLSRRHPRHAPSGRISSLPSPSPSRRSTPPSRPPSSGLCGSSSSPPAGSAPSRPPIRPTGAATGETAPSGTPPTTRGPSGPGCSAPSAKPPCVSPKTGKRKRRSLKRHLRIFLQNHLREAGIGSVSEVFDGDPPHRPGGCIAQAWSVAELIRLYLLDKTFLFGRSDSFMIMFTDFRTVLCISESRSVASDGGGPARQGGCDHANSHVRVGVPAPDERRSGHGLFRHDQRRWPVSAIGSPSSCRRPKRRLPPF